MNNAEELRTQGKKIKEALIKDIALKEKFKKTVDEIIVDLENGRTEKALEFLRNASEGGEAELADLNKKLQVIESCLGIVDLVEEKKKAKEDKTPEAKA